MWSETSKLTFQRQVDAIDVKLKIAVGLSNLTFNYWDGEIKILDDKLETTKSFPIGAGISSIRWINDSVLLSSLDNGGISYISVEGNFNPFFIFLDFYLIFFPTLKMIVKKALLLLTRLQLYHWTTLPNHQKYFQ